MYGMFPQLGAPIGFLISSGTFLLLSKTLNDQQFYLWLADSVSCKRILVWVGCTSV